MALLALMPNKGAVAKLVPETEATRAGRRACHRRVIPFPIVGMMTCSHEPLEHRSTRGNDALLPVLNQAAQRLFPVHETRVMDRLEYVT